MAEWSDGRDWAGLPPEVVCCIAQWLPVPDYLRLRAVCTSWASAYVGAAVPHFPWLGLSRNRIQSNPFFLAQPPDNRHYSLPGLSFCNCRWIGSRDGWVVTESFRSQDLRLFNPITGAHLDLPPFSTLTNKQLDIRKVVLSPLPGPSAAAVVIHGLYRCLAGGRDEAWTPLLAHSGDVEVVDVVYHRERFVTVSSLGQFQSFDLDVPCEVVSTIPECSDGYNRHLNKIYLVSAPSGDLFKVLENKSPTTLAKSFSVMKFNPEFDSCWVEMKDLGDVSLFVDRYHSVSLSARDVPGLKGNCIYFADINFHALSETVGYYKNDVGMFDISKEVTESYIPAEFRSIGRWNPIPPIWFMPSLL